MDKSISKSDISERIRSSASEYNLDPDTVLKIAEAESRLKPEAKARTSSARGLFQVINQTWREQGGGKRGDIDEDIRVGTKVIASNRDSFKRMFDRDPSAAELYTYHVFGASGGADVLSSPRDEPIQNVISRQAYKANPYWQGKTVGDVLNQFERKVGGRAEQVEEAPAPAAPRSRFKGSAPVFEPLTQNEMSDLGPGYQAAFASMALADMNDRDEAMYEQAREYADSMAAPDLEREKSPLSNLQLSYGTPFPEEQAAGQAPVMLAKGGEAKKMMAVYRADGSPEYGEISMGDFSGTVKTGDARKELSNFFKQGWKMPTKEDAKRLAQIPLNVVSNLESVTRGSIAGDVGFPGEIQQAFSSPRADSQAFPTKGDPTAFIDSSGVKGRNDQLLPTTERVLRNMPRITPANEQSEGYEEIGTYLGFGPLSAGLSKLPAAYRVAAPAVGAAVAKGAEKVREVIDRLPPRTYKPVSSRDNITIRAPETNLQIPEIVKTVEPMSTRTPATHFVSKLDQFTAALPGAVTKGQYIGSLKGKFRDYEILRAEEALAGLDANAKLKPAEITARLRNVTPVENLKTYILEPHDSKIYWNDVDNPHPDKPIGVVNLMGGVPEDVMESSNMAKTVGLAYRDISSGSATPEHYSLLRSYIPNLGLDAKTEQKLIGALDKTEKDAIRLGEQEIQAKIALNWIRSPFTNASYGSLYDVGMKQKGLNHDDATNYAINTIRAEGASTIRQMGYKVDDIVDNAGYTKYNTSEYNRVVKVANDLAKTITTDLKADKVDIINQFEEIDKPIKKILTDQNKLYTGQHPSLTPESGTPVGFSRFADVDVNIPGLGEKKIMHVAELQSDLYDDAVKEGSTFYSKEKDTEEIGKLLNQASAIIYKNKDTGITRNAEDLLSEIKSAFDPTSQKLQKTALDKLRKEYKIDEKDFIELLKIANREQNLAVRAAGYGSYKIPEAFKGMENSPQVVQQMLAKNAIIAGIRRGVDGVTFPGKESAQAQLYEKLPNNLKQVVKDLGPGFELRPIESESSRNGLMTNWGVIWDPEAAKRLLAEGVRFNKGGSVEKNYDDNRRFL